MTRLVPIPLDSYRLAKYASGIDCYVCGSNNTFDVELCIRCAAPMALAHQANSQGVKPQFVALVGAPGAGKTIYLGLLMDLLARRAAGLDVLSRGVFSLRSQQTVVGALARGVFPPPTPAEPEAWAWVHCQVASRWQRRRELVVPDVAGSAIFEAIEHPHTFRAIDAVLRKSSAAMVLVDAARLARSVPQEQHAAMKLVTHLSGQSEPSGHARKRPVAVVLTKADECDDALADPEAFAARCAPGLWHSCRRAVARHRFFAVSSVGGSALCHPPKGPAVHIPLRVEPRGIVEPFVWLLHHMPR